MVTNLTQLGYVNNYDKNRYLEIFRKQLYIHLDIVNLLWAHDETNKYKSHVYVVLQKKEGKVDVYNIPSPLTCLKKICLFEENMILK